MSDTGQDPAGTAGEGTWTHGDDDRFERVVPPQETDPATSRDEYGSPATVRDAREGRWDQASGAMAPGSSPAVAGGPDDTPGVPEPAATTAEPVQDTDQEAPDAGT